LEVSRAIFISLTTAAALSATFTLQGRAQTREQLALNLALELNPDGMIKEVNDPNAEQKSVADLLRFIDDDFDQSKRALSLTRHALRTLLAEIIAPLDTLAELTRSKYFKERKEFFTPNYGNVIRFRFETYYRRISLLYSVKEQKFIISQADASALNSL
jgi:hypothetical protein